VTLEIAVVSDIMVKDWNFRGEIDNDAIISGKSLPLPMEKMKKYIIEAANYAFS
jgi:hypothetical protein